VPVPLALYAEALRTLEAARREVTATYVVLHRQLKEAEQLACAKAEACDFRLHPRQARRKAAKK
jgi:hypothetical protein